MHFMVFDATKPFTDAEYNSFIDNLVLKTIKSLREARERQEKPDQAIRVYLTTAYSAGISMSEAADFFGVSTPNIAETSGYTGKDFRTIMEYFDAVNVEVTSQFFK